MFQRTWHDTGLLAVAIALGLALHSLSGVLASPFLLILGSVVLASAVAPVASFAERWAPRIVGVMAVYFAVLLVLAAMVWAVAPPLVGQAEQLVEDAPELADDVEQWLTQRGVRIDGDLTDTMSGAMTEAARTIVFLAPSTFAAGLDIFLVLALSAYLTVSGPSMLAFTLTLFPPERREHTRSALVEVADTMGGYVRGSLIDGAILGVLTWTALTLLGVDFPLVLALLAGLGVLVPIIGPIVTALPAIAIAATESITLGLIVAGFYILLQQLESYILLPVIMRQQADIPPLLTLVAIMAGAALAGIVGAILAIPLFGGLFVLFHRVAVPALRRESDAPEASEG